ncbi:MAG TPA: PAS domain S-box protein [Methanoculleus sp.]|nr:PAS domain S-box protein [Methanoculleus sp.]
MPDEDEYPPAGEDEWYALMKYAPVMFQSVGPDGHITYVNRAWRATLGYSTDEARRLTPADIIDPACEGTCRSLFGEPVPGCGTQEVEAVFLTRRGKRVRVRGSTLCTVRNGRPAGARGLFIPVPPESGGPEAGDGTASCLHHLAHVLPLPVYSKDRAGRLTWANAAFGRMMGKHPEDLPGRDTADGVPASFTSVLRDMDGQLLVTGGIQQFEGQVIAAGGIVRHVTFTQVACEEEPGNITGIMGVLHEGPAAGPAPGDPGQKQTGEWCAVPREPVRRR